MVNVGIRETARQWCKDLVPAILVLAFSLFSNSFGVITLRRTAGGWSTAYFFDSFGIPFSSAFLSIW